MSEYLTFHKYRPEGRKTYIVQVRSKRTQVELGEIKWYGAWRQYCFYPAAATIFSRGCMSDIQNVINELMSER